MKYFASQIVILILIPVIGAPTSIVDSIEFHLLAPSPERSRQIGEDFDTNHKAGATRNTLNTLEA